MRALAMVLLASLSVCTRADESRRSDGDSVAPRQAAESRPPAAASAGNSPAATAGRSAAEAAESPAPGPFLRDGGESAEAFAGRLGPPASDLAHPVIETDVWKLGRKAVIAFYRLDIAPGEAHGPVHEAIGYAFLPDSAGRYRRVVIGWIPHEGAEPEIRSVFFANADDDPGPELVVLAAWRMYTYFVGGTYYGTSIFARPSAAGGDRFVHLEALGQQVSGGCECEWRDGESRRARFKTATEIRAGLHALGYR